MPNLFSNNYTGFPKENSMVMMVVVPFASLLSKSGILFLSVSLSVIALPSLPLKLALSSENLPLQTVFWPVIPFLLLKSGTVSLSLLLLSQLFYCSSPYLQISLTPPPHPPPPMSSAVCVSGHVCVLFIFIGIVCVRSYVCVWVASVCVC